MDVQGVGAWEIYRALERQEEASMTDKADRGRTAVMPGDSH